MKHALILLLGVAVLSSCDDSTGPGNGAFSGTYVLRTLDGKGQPFVTWDHRYANGTRTQFFVIAETLAVRTDASVQWSLALSRLEPGVPSVNGYWSAAFSYRRNADTVFLTMENPFGDIPRRSPDTVFVRPGGAIVNTVEIGGGCQFDPSCVPGGEFRDAVFEYRRAPPN